VPQTLGQPLRVEWDDPTEGRRWRLDNRSQTVAATATESLQVGRDLHQPVLQVRGQIRIGSAPEPVAVSVSQPSEYFVEHLRQALSNAQIQVDRTLIADTPAQAAPEIAAVESAPLAALITVANQNSNNLYAEAILRSLGNSHSADSTDTLASGIAALKAALTRLGVDPSSYHLVDGSGLSRHNLISPQAIVQTLQTMTQSPNAAIYRNSLSLAGVNGTLRNSFRDTPMQGRLWAKTGSLTDVTSLSGYFEPPDYPPLVFSILVNQGGSAMNQVAPAIDEILLLLTQLQSCSPS
jgi:serine-type D-Ala-D-Ala carboxypeptidase/endopeptidase (penicillin-binding protein 4)